MAIALGAPTLALTRDESDAIDFHLDRLTRFNRKNRERKAYYEGSYRLKNLGISIPPSMQGIETVVGWAGTVVDVLDERLDFTGWSSANDGDPLGLQEIFNANDLLVEAPLAHVDSLIHGVTFVSVGAGYAGEPSPLITVESPEKVTGTWDGRKRRLSEALSVDRASADGVPLTVTLYRENENVTASRASLFTPWQIETRDPHNLGRVMIVALPNRPQGGRVEGRSEITRAVMSLTDQAVRTLLGMEVNREFYSAPQRYALGVDEGAFVGADGQTKTGWETVMGRMLALPRDEEGELPTVGQFSPASPAPYLEQVKGLAQMLAAEAAIPAAYMGFETGNPSSADAIRAMEARLVKRAEKRQQAFGRAWKEVAALALLVRDGAIPEEFASIGCRWRDAATPTAAATADATTKLIASGVLTPDSQVTYDRLGLSPAEQRTLSAEKRAALAQTRIAALGAAAEAARQDAAVVTAEAKSGDE